MNILILGSGGREHAFAWKMKQSEYCDRLFIAPGNAGTASCGVNVALGINDFEAIKTFCLQEAVGLVVVGPEEPLVKGIYDFFAADEALQHINVIGPSAKGAQLEGSKAYSKSFMQRYHIPTATYAAFDEATFEEGMAYISQHSLPIVLKADGLAAGKGVIICQSVAEAKNVFTEMIRHKQFGAASEKVVVEQFLAGTEVSVFVLTDGKEYKIIGHAKDYKQIGENNTGANTGGMGCVSPVPFMDTAFREKVESRIIQPTIQGLQSEGIIYKGFIFFGLIHVAGEPYVIEYNCRMGDPETEVVMPRLQNDLVALFMALQEGKLNEVSIVIDDRSCATIMAVSGGYPGAYEKNKPIRNLSEAAGENVVIFHAGTLQKDAETVVTNGGRVLAVSAYGSNLREAVSRSGNVLKKIEFEGMYYRKDIGFEFL